MKTTVYLDRNDGLGLVNDGCWGGEECVGISKSAAVDAIKHLAKNYPTADWYVVRGVEDKHGSVEHKIAATETEGEE